MAYSLEYDSPIGMLTLASDGINLTGLWMAGQKYYGQTLDKKAVRRRVPVFDPAISWLDDYFAGKAPALTLPLAPEGGSFRQRVWKVLLEIPYGKVTTYGEIARQLNASGTEHATSARAVGGAVGHNPISIIIPCHRVVGSDGSLTGFAGGMEKKKWLLRLEKADVAGLSRSLFS